MREFVECDSHPAKGGPHRSRGLYVGPYFGHDATLWMCTHRSKRGRVCGSLQLELPEEVAGMTRSERREAEAEREFEEFTRETLTAMMAMGGWQEELARTMWGRCFG